MPSQLHSDLNWAYEWRCPMTWVWSAHTELGRSPDFVGTDQGTSEDTAGRTPRVDSGQTPTPNEFGTLKAQPAARTTAMGRRAATRAGIGVSTATATAVPTTTARIHDRGGAAWDALPAARAATR